MFEIVKQIHEAFGTQSQIAFVTLMFFAFGFVGAGVGWTVDRNYRKHLISSSEQERSNPTVGNIQQESSGPGSANVQGVRGNVTITVDQSGGMAGDKVSKARRAGK